MAGGGSGGGGFESYLPVAAALAATVMTDGAAAPMLADTLGATGAAAVTGAGIGALTGGGVAALTGQDIGRNALMGGLGGATLGAGGLYQGADLVAAGAGSGSMISADAAQLSAQGLGQSQIASTLAQSYPGLTAAQAQAAAAAAATTGAGAGILGTGITGTQAALGGAGILGVSSLMQADKSKYGTPANSQVNWNGGSLSNFRYDPQHYSPDVVRPPTPAYQAQYQNRVNPNQQQQPQESGMTPYQPVYAAGGGLMQEDNMNYAGGGMYPMSQQDHTEFASSPQTPVSMQATMASYDPKTNPITGEPTTMMAGGGLASLGSYSDGGQLLKGPGDGMSDSIPAKIGKAQPARLADNEFVVPADVVSHLGNGSSDAGAKKLYAMMNNVRKARTGKKRQAPKINADKYLPA